MSTNSSQLSPAELGAALSAGAYAQPAIKPEGFALRLIIVLWIMIILASFVVGLRVYVRAWMLRSSRIWGWEDVFAVLGYFAFLCSSIFAIKAAYYGLGTRDSHLNDFLMVRCAEYLLYSSVVYGISMPFIKASVVFTLVRITNQRRYRWPLYVMQFIATLMAIVGILASLLYCRPVKAYWNPLLGKCGNFMVVVKIGYAWTAVGIATDWSCAIIPYLIVRNLQMSRRNKITVMIILGLGAVAGTVTIVRAPYLQYYLIATDRLYWNGWISLWCQLESGLGLIAACLPALRKLFTNYLDGSGNESSVRSKHNTGSRHVVGNQLLTPLDNLSPNGKSTVGISAGKWERLGDDNDSTSRIIMHETTVTVETGSISEEEKQNHGQR